MKKAILYLFLLLFTLFLTGCGGSGGSNPVGPEKTYLENVELKTANPIVATNYGTLKSIMKMSTDSRAEQQSLAEELMKHFSQDFKDKENKDAKTKVKDTTLSYLKDYKINSYDFKPVIQDGVAHTNSTATTITVRTLIELNVTQRSNSTVIIVPNRFFDIVWEKNESGDWLIVSGFPTTRGELGL
jgi:hypothetical protein